GVVRVLLRAAVLGMGRLARGEEHARFRALQDHVAPAVSERREERAARAHRAHHPRGRRSRRRAVGSREVKLDPRAGPGVYPFELARAELSTPLDAERVLAAIAALL